MLFSRVGAGIAGASVGTAAAVIADCTTPERRARGMALIGIAFGAGFTLGPLIAFFGLKLFDEQPWGVGAIASLLSFVALLLAIFFFRETRVPGRNAAKEFFSISRTVSVLRKPAVGCLFIIFVVLIVLFVFSGIFHSHQLLMQQQNNLSLIFLSCVYFPKQQTYYKSFFVLVLRFYHISF